MTRRNAWAAAVVAAVLLGFAFGSLRKTIADSPSPAGATADKQTEVLIEQLRQLQGDVKDINTLLHNGNVKVVVLLTPEAPK